jgi:hypothetical protein
MPKPEAKQSNKLLKKMEARLSALESTRKDIVPETQAGPIASPEDLYSSEQEQNQQQPTNRPSDILSSIFSNKTDYANIGEQSLFGTISPVGGAGQQSSIAAQMNQSQVQQQTAKNNVAEKTEKKAHTTRGVTYMNPDNQHRYLGQLKHSLLKESGLRKTFLDAARAEWQAGSWAPLTAGTKAVGTRLYNTGSKFWNRRERLGKLKYLKEMKKRVQPSFDKFKAEQQRFDKALEKGRRNADAYRSAIKDINTKKQQALDALRQAVLEKRSAFRAPRSNLLGAAFNRYRNAQSVSAKTRGAIGSRLHGLREGLKSLRTRSKLLWRASSNKGRYSANRALARRVAGYENKAQNLQDKTKRVAKKIEDNIIRGDQKLIRVTNKANKEIGQAQKAHQKVKLKKVNVRPAAPNNAPRPASKINKAPQPKSPQTPPINKAPQPKSVKNNSALRFQPEAAAAETIKTLGFGSAGAGIGYGAAKTYNHFSKKKSNDIEKRANFRDIVLLSFASKIS